MFGQFPILSVGLVHFTSRPFNHSLWGLSLVRVFPDVPNAGEGLKRLDYRQEWDRDFRAYLKGLDAKKPLILCGDLNVSHKEIGEEGGREGGREM